MAKKIGGEKHESLFWGDIFLPQSKHVVPDELSTGIDTDML
jgi:hypothetical protein